MSNSKPLTSEHTFWYVAVATLLATVLAVVTLWPSALRYRQTLSSQLSNAGLRAGGGEANLDFRLAYRLDRTNETAAVHFAAQQQVSGQNALALATLAQAGEGIEATRIRLRAYLELINNSEAIAQANKLVVMKATGDDMVLASFAYDLGGRKDRIPLTLALVGSPEAAGRITRAAADNLPLGEELYASGLLRSASALLVKLSSSVPRSLLMGQILYQEHTKTSLNAAVDYYNGALGIDPSNKAARTGLIRCLTDLGRTQEAAAQQAQLDKLMSGKL